MDRDKRLFVDGVVSRANLLISEGIWQGIDLARLEGWFEQFKSREFELLGACLLDSFVFRSRGQVEALLTGIFTSPEMLGSAANSDDELIKKLSARKDPNVRLSPVIRMDQPPTKSGMYVLRLLAKMMRIREDWMKWPQALAKEPSGIETVILVDDFCGTGTQFVDFLRLSGFDEFITSRPNCEIIYACVAAHECGIDYIKNNAPKIRIIAGEIFKKTDHFFEGTPLSRIKDSGLTALLNQQYLQLANDVGLGGKAIGPLGFENQALAYAFAHGTPNNTLPVFWYENEQWSALVNR